MRRWRAPTTWAGIPRARRLERGKESLAVAERSAALRGASRAGPGATIQAAHELAAGYATPKIVRRRKQWTQALDVAKAMADPPGTA